MNKLIYTILLYWIVCLGLKGQAMPFSLFGEDDYTNISYYDSLKMELTIRLNGMTSSMKSNDMLGVASYYSDHAVIRGPRGIEAKGRKEIDSHWLGLKGKVIDWQLSCEAVFVEDEIIYQTGVSTLKVMLDDKEYKYLVNYLLIWEQEDNDFKILKDLYHDISY